MAKYTITINERTNAGKHLLALMKSLDDVVSFEGNQRSGLDKALEDIREGRIHVAKNADDLIKKCLN